MEKLGMVVKRKMVILYGLMEPVFPKPFGIQMSQIMGVGMKIVLNQQTVGLVGMIRNVLTTIIMYANLILVSFYQHCILL